MWVPFGTPTSRRVLSVSRGVTRAQLLVVRFIWVHVGSLGREMGSSGSFGVAWVNLDAPRHRRVPWGLRGFTGAGQKVVGFVGVRVGSLERA